MGNTATFMARTEAKLADMGYRTATAKKMMRKWWKATDDLVDDASIAVKRNPMKSVGIVFGAGLALGGLTVWFAKRR